MLSTVFITSTAPHTSFRELEIRYNSSLAGSGSGNYRSASSTSSSYGSSSYHPESYSYLATGQFAIYSDAKPVHIRGDPRKYKSNIYEKRGMGQLRKKGPVRK